MKHRKIQLAGFIIGSDHLLCCVYEVFNGNFIYFTMGLDDNTVLKLWTKLQLRLRRKYFSDAKTQYEEILETILWTQDFDELSFQDYAKIK